LALAIVGLLSFVSLGPFFLALAASVSAVLGVNYQARAQARSLFVDERSTKQSTDDTRKRLQLAGQDSVLLATPVLLCTGLFYAFGALSAILAAIPLLALLPALLINQLLEQNLKDAMSVNGIIQVLARLSSAYGLLITYWFTCVFAVLFMADFSHQYLPEFLQPIVVFLATAATVLLLFSLSGYVIAQYGLQDDAPNPDDTATPSAYQTGLDTQQLNVALDQALKDGQYQTVIELLENALKRHRFSDMRRDQLFKLFEALQDQEGLERYAQPFLWLMLGQGKPRDAIYFLKQRRKHNAGFQLFDLELTLELARSCSKLDEPKLVLWLARDAHKRFDPDTKLAQLYLLTATILLKQFNQAHKARGYIKYVREHYEEHTELQQTAAKLMHEISGQSGAPRTAD